MCHRKSGWKHYNLATYACMLRDYTDAKQHLVRAFETAENAAELKQIALREPDLRPLHHEINSF